MYGSPHGSAPSMKRYGVTSSGFAAGRLWLVTRAAVASIVSADDYFREPLKLPATLRKLHLWSLEVGVEERELAKTVVDHDLDRLGCERDGGAMRSRLLDFAWRLPQIARMRTTPR